MTVRTRIIGLTLTCVLAIGLAVGYVLHAKAATDRTSGSTGKPVGGASLSSVLAVPHLAFRDTQLGPSYGKLAVVALSDPQGPRAVTDVSCDRVYAARGDTLCLSSSRGLVTTYRAQVLSSGTLAVTRSLPLAGIPSRARLSSDATLAATTSFTAGDSYAGTNFSTRTVINSLGDPTAGGANLEDFTLIHDGRSIKPTDRNFWGVTFSSDDDTFYATAAWGGATWLVRGSVKARTVTTVHQDAECPSLSPDGKTVVYKKRAGQPAGHWRLAGLDLATMRETPLAETRNVDDQVEWLDDTHVIYGLARTGSQAAIDDIYSVGTADDNAPKILISGAWSPAVVG